MHCSQKSAAVSNRYLRCGRIRWICALFVCALFVCAGAGELGEPLAAQEQRIVLKNGLEYEGRFFTLLEFSTIYGKTKEDPSALNSIAVVDDGLRRIYFNRRHIAAEPVPVNRPNPSVKIWQPVTGGQPDVWRFGQLTYADRFNEYGRRMIASNGRQKFIQGIVDVNSRFVRAVALEDPDWTSPIATATIPSDVLIPMLRRQIRDPNNITERLRIVDLLMVSKRYRDADAELLAIQKDFPDLATEYKDFRTRMNAEFASQIVSEIRLRIANGQTLVAKDLIGAFLGKKGADVSTLVLSEISDVNEALTGQLQAVEDARRALLGQWEVAQAEEGIPEGASTALNEAIEEIRSELRPSNLERLATFVRFAGDQSQSALQRVAYAISGWIAGSGAATNSVAAALALVQARALAQEYLSTSDPTRRAEILEQLGQLETGETSQMAKILLNMLPPLAEPLEPAEDPAAFTITLPPKGNDTKGRSVEYYVRLPPEYDPYRRYPCVVCLHPQSRDPRQEMYFWTGGFNPRLASTTGYAARFGYIVIAPRWNLPNEIEYRYTAEEQLTVLKSLRDAMRRFSIDSDRVFLTGHFAGGDAAWDIGLSYPDLWAGVIPISAYCGERGGYPFRCYKSAGQQNLPFYFISGQHDLSVDAGGEIGRIGFNALSWTPMLSASAGRDLPEYDVTVVEYQKRLAEMFDEELPDVFEWMGRHVRKAAVESFEACAMRPWQRQFWWWEVPAIPEEKVVLPFDWPPQRGKVDPLQFTGKFDRDRNKFTVQNCPGRQATLLLSPDLVDFSQKVSISYAGTQNVAVQPSTAYLLEDVRGRADRQHPFWAALELQNNKWLPK